MRKVTFLQWAGDVVLSAAVGAMMGLSIFVFCAFLCLLPHFAYAQGGGAIIGGNGNVGAIGTPATTNQAQWTDATHIKGFAQGIFNARLMYGAVPDGNTDNVTAITNAFAASNAFAAGSIPTVYFDCDTGTTTCQYNYSGSGTSALDPTIPTTIMCAPGVILNYTGSAHAVDLGASGRSTPDELPYTVQGCQFTGAVSSTQGIYVNQFITNTYFLNNTFFQFGNRTGFNIYFAGNNWEGLIEGNSWFDHDGVTRNMIDGHNAAVHAIRLIGNNSECATAGNTACSVSAANIGVGVWVGDEWKLIGNVIQYHAPLIRFANSANANGDRPTISGNHFEINSGMTTSPFTYGDPGGTATTLSCMEFSGNTAFLPVATGVSFFGPESSASGLYSLSNCPILDNDMGPAPSSGAKYVNTNGGLQNIWGRNQVAGTIITNANTSPSVFDSNVRNYFVGFPRQGSGGSLAGLAAYQSNNQDLTAATLVNVSAPLICSDASGSGTAQSCNTSPNNDFNGVSVTPLAGNEILYKTTTQNTGSLTVNVNSTGAITVKKASGTANLAAGDVKAGIYYPMIYDGTFWEIWLN